MTYQVLARTWRPQKFSELFGQDAVVQTLCNALDSGTFGQAYLFSGLRGVGKTTAARLLAKAVNCAEGPTAEPCGTCDSCREVVEGSSIDVIEIDGASNRGIDDVRELRELLQFRPTRDRFRVIIVDEVHMLTREAFNALLKSLEEPPPYILWIFATTERLKVPDTIQSRCQQLEFRPVGAELIRGRLEEIAASEGFTLTPSAAASIAAASDGSVRDALSLLDQLRAFAADEVDDEAVAAILGVPPIEVTVGLVGALAEGRIGDGLALLREQLAAGQDPSVLYREVGRTLRTALYLAIDPKLAPVISDSHRRLFSSLADGLGENALGRMLGLWLDHEALLRGAGNREVALEVACLRLARWPSVRRVEDWLGGSGAADPDAGAGAAGSGSERGPGSQAGRTSAVPGTSATEEGAAREQVPDAEGTQPDDAVLTKEAGADPGVILATRILGGEVVAVQSDGDGS
ncbi:MAG: DNA polymerase III subunit gamma/tau [Acidobacteria bacterium]|jgi:DNA polymerase-3 subunit gamma/tau|nr:DNA polymerase III subunit gamma/tau [Acidobacteriota bacterium]